MSPHLFRYNHWHAAARRCFCPSLPRSVLLEEVHEDELSMKEVARRIQFSPFHFIRRFEALFGFTPQQFRIQPRLDRARFLLAMGRHSVTDVCMEVGFASLGSFSDLFRRRIAMTPSAFEHRARDGRYRGPFLKAFFRDV